jgi:hypothetical protein
MGAEGGAEGDGEAGADLKAASETLALGGALGRFDTVGPVDAGGRKLGRLPSARMSL